MEKWCCVTNVLMAIWAVAWVSMGFALFFPTGKWARIAAASGGVMTGVIIVALGLKVHWAAPDHKFAIHGHYYTADELEFKDK